MSTPQRPDDARDPQLSAAHTAGRESPPAALDAAVLAAARQAVTPKSRPALRRWAPPVALAASLVMGLAFLLAQQVQQDPVALEESFATKAAAPAQVSPDALRDEPAPVAAREYAKLEQVQAPVSAEAVAAAPAGAAPVMAAPPPAPVADLKVQAQAAYAAPELERATAARAQAQAARAAESQRARSEAEELAEMAADDAEDIAAWLAEIQALRDAGKQAEAVKQLMAFCEAYPGHKECPEP